MAKDALAWRDWGAGAPVLALHCSLAHSGAWSGVAAALPGRRLVAPDLPGHGRSADWAGGDLHDLTTAACTALAESLGRPLDLLGHSFGGTVALRMALENPGLVRRLVLIEPVLFTAARRAGAPEYIEFMDRHGDWPAEVTAAAAGFHAIWGAGAFADLAPQQQGYMIDRMPLVRTIQPLLHDDLRGLAAPGRIEALTIPVLLLQGSDSPPVIDAIQRELARRLPDARREVIAGAGHMLPITHAAQVAERIAAFLDR